MIVILEFLEEGLESEGNETIESDEKFIPLDSNFPTARNYSNDNEEFFTMDEVILIFLLSVCLFSKQLEESKFMQFIDEDEDIQSTRTGFPQRCTLSSIFLNLIHSLANYWNPGEPVDNWSAPKGPKAPQGAI